MFCAKFGWHLRSGSGEEVSIYFHYVAISPFDQGHGTSFEQTMLYVKYGGIWLGDSEKVNMCKDMDGHLDRQTDWQ